MCVTLKSGYWANERANKETSQANTKATEREWTKKNIVNRFNKSPISFLAVKWKEMNFTPYFIQLVGVEKYIM